MDNDPHGGHGPVVSMWVVTLHYLLCTRTRHYPVTLLPIGSCFFRAKPFPVTIPQHFSNLVILQLPAYEDGTECSETPAYKIQTPGYYPEESIKQYLSSPLAWRYFGKPRKTSDSVA